MTFAAPKINNLADRVIIASVSQKACVCYDGDGTSLDQIDPLTGEISNLFIAEQINGSIGQRLSCRIYNINFYEAHDLLSTIAETTGEKVEFPEFTANENRDFALKPAFTFRSRDLSMQQVSELVYRHAKL